MKMKTRLVLAFLLLGSVSAHAFGPDFGPNRTASSAAGGASAPIAYLNQSCTASTPYVTNGTATFPNTPCNNPAGMILIDPVRYGLLINTGGEPDADGSMYLSTPTVNAATDFISATGMTVAERSVTLSSPTATQNSQTFTIASSGHLGDKLLCRGDASPYPAADSSGNCSAGTCTAALVSNKNTTMVMRANKASSVCVAADQPFDGCTGSGTGTVYRYYPFTINAVNAAFCAPPGTSNIVTVPEGLPATFATGDAFMRYLGDGIHPSPWGFSWLAQLVEEATYEEMFVPRVNMLGSGGNGDTGTAASNQCNGAGTGWGGRNDDDSATNWTAFNSVLDPNADYSSRLAVYGRGCQWTGSTSGGRVQIPDSGTIAVDAGRTYTIIGLLKSNSAAASIQIYDQSSAVISPASDQSVIAGWSPRGNADKDPLAYNATGYEAAPTLDFPAIRAGMWAPVVLKIKIPAGVTGIKILVARGASTAQMFTDEWYMYPAIHQNMQLNRLFPDGLFDAALLGDSRATHTIGSQDGGQVYANMFGALQYAHDNGYSMRPSLKLPANFALARSKGTGGWKVSDELALSSPFSSLRGKRFGFVVLGVNDVGSATPQTIAYNLVRARERIASFGTIPVYIGESPYKGTIGTGTAAGQNECSVATTSPDYAGRQNNCSNAVLSINRRLIHEGSAW